MSTALAQFKDLEASMNDAVQDMPAAAPLDPEAMELLELFTYTQQKINDHLEKVFAVEGLSLAHYRALFFVLRYDGISVSGLIDKLDITKQSLARVLADLIRGRGPLPEEGPEDGSEDRQDTEAALDSDGQTLISEAEGYLYSEIDPNDRRARRLHLTERGAELMHNALEPISLSLKRSFGNTTASRNTDTNMQQTANSGEQ